MKILLLVIAFASMSVFAKEGGNGGGVHSCPGSVELYDFYEGSNSRIHNLKLWVFDPSKSMRDYLTLAMDHLERDIPEVIPHVRSVLAEIMTIPMNELVINQSIPYIPDVDGTVDIPMTDPGCSYQNVANWNERFEKKLLFFNKGLFDRMNAMNKAGLFIHEAIYKVSRDSKISRASSARIRKIVARIFSDITLTAEDSQLIYSFNAIRWFHHPKCMKAFDTLGKEVNEKLELNNRCEQSVGTSEYGSLKKLSGIKLDILNQYVFICQQTCLYEPELLNFCNQLMDQKSLHGCF